MSKFATQDGYIDVVAEVIIDGDKLSEREVVSLRAAVNTVLHQLKPTAIGYHAELPAAFAHLQTINRLLGGEKR